MNTMRKRCQFSLRSFLLVLLCIAFCVGLSIRVAVQRASKNAAIDAIAAEEDGSIGMFSADDHSVADSNGADPQMIMFHCMDSHSVSENIQRVTRINTVAVLSFVGSDFEASSLAHVPENSRVREISLDYCSGLTSETCSLLSEMFPQLREVSLEDSDIGRDSLVALSELKHLRRVNVSRLSISATEIVQAFALFPSLEHVVITNAELSGQLTLFCGLPHLKKLDVSVGSFSESDLVSFLDCTTCDEVIAIAVELEGCEIESFAHDKADIVTWQ